MSWKWRVGLGFVALLVAALIYPGISSGMMMEWRSTKSESYSRMTCYDLRWNGVRTKVITTQDDPHGTITKTGFDWWRLLF